MNHRFPSCNGFNGFSVWTSFTGFLLNFDRTWEREGGRLVGITWSHIPNDSWIPEFHHVHLHLPLHHRQTAQEFMNFISSITKITIFMDKDKSEIYWVVKPFFVPFLNVSSLVMNSWALSNSTIAVVWVKFLVWANFVNRIFTGLCKTQN